MSPFDFINSINDNKKNLMKEDPLCEKEYSAFLVNRGLSYFYDTVIYANEMNKHHHLDKRLQYEFLLNAVPRKKRFSKWHKSDKIEDVDLIAREYGYSKKKALDVMSILTKEQINELREKYATGGK